MSLVGSMTVNGKSQPRMWTIAMTIELPPAATEKLVARLTAVEKRIDRITVDSKPGRVAAVVMALEQLADIVRPIEKPLPRRKRR